MKPDREDEKQTPPQDDQRPACALPDTEGLCPICGTAYQEFV